MKTSPYILAVYSLLASLVGGEEPKPRLALCPSGDEQANGIVALMEATLSKDGGIVLLDRVHVGKVLAEHKLAMEGPVVGGRRHRRAIAAETGEEIGNIRGPVLVHK